MLAYNGGETISVTITGVEPIKAKINSLRSGLAFQRGVAIGAATIKTFMADYPAQIHRPQPFKTDKQRRYVMWALKNGQLSFPYRRGGGRSERLGARWTIIITDGGMGATIQNNASYARMVQKEGAQVGYHVGNWQTDQDAVDQKSQDVVDSIESEVSAVING